MESLWSGAGGVNLSVEHDFHGILGSAEKILMKKALLTV
jgi:hypothetical protein